MQYHKEFILEHFPFLLDVPTSPMVLAEGAHVFSEGEGCGRIGFVVDGVIKVYKLSETGREITLYRLGGGESCILSLSCALSHPIHQASAVVEEKATILTLTVADFRRLIEHSHQAREYVFDLFARRLTDILTLLEEIVFRRMDERLAAVVLQHREPPGAIARITHEELASELGTAREVVSRLLKEFEQEGLVRLRRGVIEILEPMKLKKYGQRRK